jgi:hypothetical protein
MWMLTSGTTVWRTPTSRLRLGHTRVAITPPVGIYHRLWGAARHERSTGVHRPLFADVLALAPLDSPPGARPRLVRVLLDLAGLVQAQHFEMIGALAEGAGVASDHVMLTYSHTHSSGWFVPDRIPLPGGELIVPYLEALTNQLRAAAQQAAASMRATTISYATGVSHMAANRDYHDVERGIFTCGFNPDAPVDGTVLVARFVDDSTGTLSGTLVNYACHPTTLAWENSLISPDYVGALRATVEQATGAPCLFAQGACGDIGPRRGFTGEVSLADRNGEQVGYAALEALSSLGPAATDLAYTGPVASGATLGTWRDEAHAPERAAETARFSGGPFTVHLPLKPRPDPDVLQRELDAHEAQQRAADARGDLVVARDAGARAERARRWLARLADVPGGETYPLACAAYRLGDAIWVATGGEPYSALQTELRRRFPRETLLVSPLLGDMQVAYLLTEGAYGTGRYQEEPSILAAGCLERLIDAVAARLVAL